MRCAKFILLIIGYIATVFLGDVSGNLAIYGNPGELVQRKCRAPDMLVRSVGGVNITSNAVDYQEVLEVQFLGIFPPFHHRRVCKIKCVNGRWLGPLCSIEEDGGRFQPMLKSCDLEEPPPHVLLIYNGKIFWPTANLQFAHGTSLHARCQTLGLYKFVGNNTIRCRNGHWEKRLPSCLPTTYLTNFTDKSPPSIIYRLASGGGAPSDSGDLIVYPGSILHLDCVYKRKDGNPQWSWTASHRQYPTGWAVTRQERDWKYRLSIYYARPHDSGIFMCSTPKGLMNSFTIVVQAVDCPPIRINASTTSVSSEGTQLNNKVTFTCHEGHLMVGAFNMICLWTGKWSDEPPTCEVLYCTELTSGDNKVQIISKERIHKSRAQFRCPRGHRIDGPSEILCINGTWSDPVPVCEAVYCDAPPEFKNGKMLGGEKHLVGDKIKHICDPGHIMVGRSENNCVAEDQWEFPFPTCKPACDRPGTPTNGSITPDKVHYDLLEYVTIVCQEEFIIDGAQKLQCIAAGKWSSSLPDCRPFVFEH